MGYVSVRLLVLGLFFTSVVNFSEPSFGAEILGTDPLAAAGFKSLQRGDFEQAALDWKKAAQLYEREGKLSQQSAALIYLSQAYQALGHYSEATQNAELAVALVKKAG